jgi:hypothetical protein
MKNHLHAFGDGLLAVGFADIGTKLGKEGLAGIRTSISPVSGALPQGRGALGQRLTDEELKALS